MGRSVVPSADRSTVWLSDLIEATEEIATSAKSCDATIVQAFTHRLQMQSDARRPGAYPNGTGSHSRSQRIAAA
jgi:hypothetical protein